MLGLQAMHELFWWPTSLTREWMVALVGVASAYAAVLDPRPDLATPARAIRTPLGWWW
jgi:hypothetical protein